MHMCYLCNGMKEKDTQIRGVFCRSGFALEIEASCWVIRSPLACLQAQGLGAQLLKSWVGWSKWLMRLSAWWLGLDHLCSGFNSSLFLFFLAPGWARTTTYGMSSQILTCFQKLLIQKHFPFQELFLRQILMAPMILFIRIILFKLDNCLLSGNLPPSSRYCSFLWVSSSLGSKRPFC